MKLARDTWLIFQRQFTLMFRSKIWIIMGIAQPVTYLVLFTPFLPHGAQRVWDNLGVAVRVPLPEIAEVGEGDDRHRVIRTPGDWQPWDPVRVAPGTPVGEQSPLFTKIDPDAVDAELARLAG